MNNQEIRKFLMAVLLEDKFVFHSLNISVPSTIVDGKYVPFHELEVHARSVGNVEDTQNKQSLYDQQLDAIMGIMCAKSIEDIAKHKALVDSDQVQVCPNCGDDQLYLDLNDHVMDEEEFCCDICGWHGKTCGMKEDPKYKAAFLEAMELLERHAADALREIEVYDLTDLDKLERLRALRDAVKGDGNG